VVIERGNRDSKVMFVGEGPGEKEDLSGQPFVGEAGKLLNNLFEAQQFSPDTYYIANIVKCRPPANREPSDDEAEKCLSFSRNQFLLVKPKILVCLGSVASKYIIDKEIRVSLRHGQWISKGKFLMMPVYHPAAVLRDEYKRELFWNDFVKIKDKMKVEGIWR